MKRIFTCTIIWIAMAAGCALDQQWLRTSDWSHENPQQNGARVQVGKWHAQCFDGHWIRYVLIGS